MQLNVEDLLENKSDYFGLKEDGDIDLFGSEFSIDAAALTNTFNLKNVEGSCESLTPDGGVKKMVIKRGNGPLVPKDATVSIRYSAFREFSEKPFDYALRPVNVDIGTSTFKGLGIALSSMKRGEKANFYITPEYAFGKAGCAPAVPPNCTCLYTIEMLDFDEIAGAGEYFDRPGEERQEATFEIYASAARMRMKEAREYYNGGKFFKAKKIYESVAHKLRTFDEEDKPEWKKLVVSSNSNAALCCLKLNEIEHCITHAESVLSYDPKHVKALFAKGKALGMMGQTEAATKCLLMAKKFSSKNEEINRELFRLESQFDKYNKVEKDFCTKMMRVGRPMSHAQYLEADVNLDLDITSMLAPCHEELFAQMLKTMLESDDLTQRFVMSSECFSIEELLAFEVMAKRVELKVRRKRNGHIEYIKVTKL